MLKSVPTPQWGTAEDAEIKDPLAQVYQRLLLSKPVVVQNIALDALPEEEGGTAPEEKLVMENI